MAGDKVTADEIRAMLQDMAERIERGGLKSVSFKFMTDEGEKAFTFGLETEEERLSALLAIRTVLGQVH